MWEAWSYYIWWMAITCLLYTVYDIATSSKNFSVLLAWLKMSPYLHPAVPGAGYMVDWMAVLHQHWLGSMMHCICGLSPSPVSATIIEGSCNHHTLRDVSEPHGVYSEISRGFPFFPEYLKRNKNITSNFSVETRGCGVPPKNQPFWALQWTHIES